MKRLLNALITAATVVLSSAAYASTYSTDISDFWWNASESGWGINVTLQNDVAFATFYVYDASQNPVWYSTDLHPLGNFTWSGNLYINHGPWFGGPFNPGNVVQQQVGTAQFKLNAVNSATLTYTINGVPVAKNLTRTTWTNEDYTGTYAGGYSLRATSCNPSSLNGIQELVGVISVNHSGTAFSATMSGNPSCSFGGTYSQAGKLGEVIGTYSCTDGSAGTFDLFEITPTISGFNGRMTGHNQYCQWSGYFGGISRAQ